MKKTLVAAAVACVLSMSGGAAAQLTDCNTIATILDWQNAVSCIHGDKQFTIGATTLLPGVQVDFLSPTPSTHVLSISGFDTSDLAGDWAIDYSILVLDPLEVISSMFAGAEDVGGLGSLLTKDVMGDPGGPFILTVVDGDDTAPSASRLGLSATALTISETFHADAGTDLIGVSNSYRQTPLQAPEPDTLALLGLALVGLAATRRTHKGS